MKIIIEGCIESLNTMVDNTWKIKFSTQELDGSNVAQLSDLKKQGGYCKVLISNTNITELEAETVDSVNIIGGKKNKTESQRLRAVLFRMHEQNNSELSFEDWYKTEMEKIISHYKSKLE